MKTIPLVKYENPRILAIDFSKVALQKMINAGYNVQRASTGILEGDQGTFLMPCAVTDPEIVFFHIRKNALKNLTDRKVSPESVETTSQCLDLLLREVWRKNGISVLFIDQGVDPSDLKVLSLEHFGVIEIRRKYFPSILLNDLIQTFKEAERLEVQPEVSFPAFKGQDIRVNDDPTAKVYQTYKDNAEHRILSVDNTVSAFGWDFQNYPLKVIFHVRDNSADGHALCLELTTYSDKSSILIFPTFGQKTVDVAIELLDEVIKSKYENLFSKPNFVWLEEYKPAPVQQLEVEKDQFVQEVIERIKQFNQQIEITHEQYLWMDQLLVGKDDTQAQQEPFKEAAILALQFLGFQVVDVDASIPEGVPKKEDLWIYDDDSRYFAVGELKTTDAGAKEVMFRDLTRHMNRYMRDNDTTRVNGLLIVNHSIKLDPKNRNPFYPAKHLHDELADTQITAIDSVFLHHLCQRVLQKEMCEFDARSIITGGQLVLSFDQVGR